MTLPRIPFDKANHFIYGFCIYMLFSSIFTELIGLIVTILFAIGREVYNAKHKGSFDYKDIIATIIPAVMLFVKHILLK